MLSLTTLPPPVELDVEDTTTLPLDPELPPPKKPPPKPPPPKKPPPPPITTGTPPPPLTKLSCWMGAGIGTVFATVTTVGAQAAVRVTTRRFVRTMATWRTARLGACLTIRLVSIWYFGRSAM